MVPFEPPEPEGPPEPEDPPEPPLGWSPIAPPEPGDPPAHANSPPPQLEVPLPPDEPSAFVASDMSGSSEIALLPAHAPITPMVKPVDSSRTMYLDMSGLPKILPKMDVRRAFEMRVRMRCWITD
jgi:hypothetical protein